MYLSHTHTVMKDSVPKYICMENRRGIDFLQRSHTLKLFFLNVYIYANLPRNGISQSTPSP